MTCKYLIHYDKLEEVIQFVGKRQGPRCIRQPTPDCQRSKAIDRSVEPCSYEYSSTTMTTFYKNTGSVLMNINYFFVAATDHSRVQAALREDQPQVVHEELHPEH